MKKIIRRALKGCSGAVLAIALLLSCIAGAETLTEPEDPFRKMIMEALTDGESLQEMFPEDLTDLLGIEPEEYTEALWLMGNGLDGREVLVIRAADEEAAEGIMERMVTYLEQRRKETRNYFPEAYQLLTATEVVQKNELLILIVGENAQAEIDALVAEE